MYILAIVNSTHPNDCLSRVLSTDKYNNKL